MHLSREGRIRDDGGLDIIPCRLLVGPVEAHLERAGENQDQVSGQKEEESGSLGDDHGGVDGARDEEDGDALGRNGGADAGQRQSLGEEQLRVVHLLPLQRVPDPLLHDVLEDLAVHAAHPERVNHRLAGGGRHRLSVACASTGSVGGRRGASDDPAVDLLAFYNG